MTSRNLTTLTWQVGNWQVFLDTSRIQAHLTSCTTQYSRFQITHDPNFHVPWNLGSLYRLHLMQFLQLLVFLGLATIIEYLIAVLCPNIRTSNHRPRFHQAAYSGQERLSIVSCVAAGRLANIDLHHGRDIVGPTVEATLLCHAGFVLKGRRPTSQSKTSLQDQDLYERRKHKIVVGVLNLQSIGRKKKPLLFVRT